MPLTPSTTIEDFWRDEVIARRNDYLEECAIAISGTKNWDKAVRRAVDFAAALAAIPDQIIAKSATNAANVIGEQKAERKKHESASNAHRILSELNNTYKHGILSESGGRLRPAFAEPTYDVSVFFSAPMASATMACPTMGKSEFHDIFIEWRESGNDQRRSFTKLSDEAMAYWASYDEVFARNYIN